MCVYVFALPCINVICRGYIKHSWSTQPTPRRVARAALISPARPTMYRATTRPHHQPATQSIISRTRRRFPHLHDLYQTSPIRPSATNAHMSYPWSKEVWKTGTMPFWAVDKR